MIVWLMPKTSTWSIRPTVFATSCCAGKRARSQHLKSFSAIFPALNRAVPIRATFIWSVTPCWLAGSHFIIMNIINFTDNFIITSKFTDYLIIVEVVVVHMIVWLMPKTSTWSIRPTVFATSCCAGKRARSQCRKSFCAIFPALNRAVPIRATFIWSVIPCWLAASNFINCFGYIYCF